MDRAHCDLIGSCCFGEEPVREIELNSDTIVEAAAKKAGLDAIGKIGTLEELARKNSLRPERDKKWDSLDKFIDALGIDAKKTKIIDAAGVMA